MHIILIYIIDIYIDSKIYVNICIIHTFHRYHFLHSMLRLYHFLLVIYRFLRLLYSCNHQFHFYYYILSKVSLQRF